MNLIIACDPKGGIGYKSKLPWNKIEGDLARFKKLTSGKVVVMGRSTWESLPVKPLPNRINYVITSDPYSIPQYGPLQGQAYGASLRTLDHLNDNAWIIGGAKLIESVWHKIKVIHLTISFAHYECDTFIDLVKLQQDCSLRYQEVHSDHTYEIWDKK